MNVLLVTGIFPPDRGGPASYVPRMASAFVSRGHRVEVITLSDTLGYDDSDHPFRVHRIRRGLFWPFRVLKTVFTVWRAARRHEVVYVNGLGAESALGALLAGRPAVHKIVGDYAWERAVGRRCFHGTIDDYQAAPKNFLLRFFDAIRTVPLKLAARIIVPSKYLERIVGGWNIGGEKIQLIYNATATPEGPAQPPENKLPRWRGRTLITICRLVPWKGVDAVIRALPALPDTRLVVAGDGPMRAGLESLARECGVAERVLLLGDVPHFAVHGYLRQCDAFILNSTYEGLPHVVLEAMAAGIPVIATDAGGTGEVVRDGITGSLVPVGDETALCAAITRIWQDSKFAGRLIANATADLEARFSFDVMVRATEAVLRSQLPNRRPALRVPAASSVRQPKTA